MFEIAVIGAGPGGLSAAARCAESGIDHVLLESSPKIANTIQKYQKGKHVMAEPGVLPLRSPVGFDAGKREEILDVWENGIDTLGVNIKYGAEVKSISGEKGNFTIGLISGDDIQAKHIILGIGMEGNPRPMGFLAVFAASGGQKSSCCLTKLMNILQIAINCLHLRIIALVFVVRARHRKDKCIQS